MYKIFVFVLILSGCASGYSPMKEYRTLLENAEGSQVECSFSGFGVMMGNQAYADHQQCVANAQMRGFKAVGR